jgi:hypothetical protein
VIAPLTSERKTAVHEPPHLPEFVEVTSPFTISLRSMTRSLGHAAFHKGYRRIIDRFDELML